MGWLFLGLAIASNVTASVFLKYSAIDRIANPGLLQAVLNWKLIAAVLAYSISLLFYATSMSRLPLSIVQPVLTIGVLAGVGLFASLLFDEHITPAKMIGYGLILVALALFAWSGVKEPDR